jgi:hypothetical protein
MGNTPYERERYKAAQLAREREEYQSAEAVASRIIEMINSRVIRPGPKHEERECTEVAAEIEVLKPEIIELILYED